MEMKRKVYEKLLEWKRLDHGTSAVLINGARRVGKSFIAEAFARNEYRNDYAHEDYAFRGMRRPRRVLCAHQVGARTAA